MAITILNKAELRNVLTKAWQKNLDTDLDPVGAGHLESSPRGPGSGLYGGLTDRMDATLLYQVASRPYVLKKELGTEAIVNNKEGKTGTVYVLLERTFTTTVTHNWSVSLGVKAGFSYQTKIVGKCELLTSEQTTTYNLEGSVTLGYSGSYQEQRTYRASQNVTVSPPPGRIYRAVLSCYTGTLRIPFTANVTVEGMTETWFHSRVKEHYNWSEAVGNLFATYQSIDPAGSYSRGEDGRGLVQAFKGESSIDVVTNFEVVVFDVTPAASVAAELRDDVLADLRDRGEMVARVPVTPELVR